MRAAVDQAAVTSMTEAVLVNIPAAKYLLTESLPLVTTFPESKNITLRGSDSSTTILDGGDLIVPLKIDVNTDSLISVENLTLQNGKGNAGFTGSAIYLPLLKFDKTQLEISNCIFKNNKTNSAIYAGYGSGALTIRKSRFIGNDSAAIISSGKKLIVQDTSISGTSGAGIRVYEASNVQILNSTIYNNQSVGISFHDCRSCRIENSTIVQNQLDGIQILTTQSPPDINFDFVINNSTIVRNGTAHTPPVNLGLGFYDPANKLTLTNSILSMNDSSKYNCFWSNPGNQPGYLPKIISNSNLFDDLSCGSLGTGDLIANPNLAPLADNGGWTQTLLPLTGSPAIDSGSGNSCARTDQRSLSRPIDKTGNGARCDIGAVEVQ